MSEPTRLAAYCKEQRLRLGIRVVDLAERVGCKPNKIVRFEETGRITDEQLERLAEALGIPIWTVEDVTYADCIDRLERMKEQREQRKQQRALGEEPHPIRTPFNVYRGDEDE